MPRVSSASEDAYHFKGTFADGWGLVTAAQAVMFQFPPDKETGQQNPPSLFVELTIQRHQDGDGHASATPPEQVLMSIARPNKETGEMDQIHPGNYPDGNMSADPVDCGGNLGAAGNTLFALADGYQLNDNCKWMRFTRSLEEKGFRPAILKRTYFPDLNGLRAYFKTEKLKKWRDDQEADPTAFVVSEIRQFPYEAGAQTAAAAASTTGRGKKGQGQQSASAPAPAAAAPAPSPPAAAPAPAAPATNGTASAEDLATAVIIQTLAPAKKGTALPNIAKLKVEAFMAINKHKPTVPVELKSAVQQQMQDEDWLIAVGVMNNLFVIAEDGKVTFA